MMKNIIVPANVIVTEHTFGGVIHTLQIKNRGATPIWYNFTGTNFFYPLDPGEVKNYESWETSKGNEEKVSTHKIFVYGDVIGANILYCDYTLKGRGE